MAGLLALLLAAASPVYADQSLDFGSLESADPYGDLPGVKPLERQQASSNTVACVQKLVEPELGRSWRMEKQTYYSCTEGNLTFESNQAPLSRERSMRGVGW